MYGYTISSDIRLVLRIVDKILICLWQFLSSSSIEINQTFKPSEGYM